MTDPPKTIVRRCRDGKGADLHVPFTIESCTAIAQVHNGFIDGYRENTGFDVMVELSHGKTLGAGEFTYRVESIL